MSGPSTKVPSFISEEMLTGMATVHAPAPGSAGPGTL